jgi:Domain of unknown function (DUF4387)
VFLATEADYQAAWTSALTDRDHLAGTYAIRPGDIEIYAIDSLRAIKISFPRPVPQGSPADTDQHAGQQYGGLAWALVVPQPAIKATAPINAAAVLVVLIIATPRSNQGVGNGLDRQRGVRSRPQ